LDNTTVDVFVLAGERSVTSCTKLKLLTGRSHLLYKTIHHIAQMLETFSKHLNKVCAECKKKNILRLFQV